jgi:hypothetical protein
MTVWPNLGKKSVIGDDVFWGTPVENMFNPSALIGKQLDRRDLHLVDWDNDGACDIVWTGAVSHFLRLDTKRSTKLMLLQSRSG